MPFARPQALAHAGVGSLMMHEMEKPGPPGDGGGLAYAGYSKLVVHGLLPPLADSRAHHGSMERPVSSF